MQKLWDRFWSGGISNPLTAIEQISYLIFMKRLEDLDSQHEQQAKATGTKFQSIFNGHKDCRWSYWKNMSAEEMLKHVVTVVFPFIQNLNDGEDVLYSHYMKGATFMIQKPSLLQEAVSILDELNITSQNQDTQGDIYEHLLSELQISGKNGQFRTPRHIIQMMVELVNPKLGETICDPACGTGGFLINSYEHIVRNNTSDDLIKYNPDGTSHNLIGDKITKKEHWNLLKNKTFYGFDFEYTMIRIGLMNMILHGIRHPNISYADSLSKNFDQSIQYDVVLANPPFSGSIDKNDINDNFKQVTTKTELLFIELFYNILKIGGRGAIIVPTGVISSTSKAHIEIRKLILEKCQLEAIIYLPSGVFKPYAGVSTAVLIFTKGGHTNHVWLYDMENDGFSLDDKRIPIKENDIPDILKNFQNKPNSKTSIKVSINKIKEYDYNLNVRRYIGLFETN
ncbi:MAG: type I restriction-modification system subunit M, partial [Nitrososphaeraceae archaeon]